MNLLHATTGIHVLLCKMRTENTATLCLPSAIWINPACSATGYCLLQNIDDDDLSGSYPLIFRAEAIQTCDLSGIDILLLCDGGDRLAFPYLVVHLLATAIGDVSTSVLNGCILRCRPYRAHV